MKVVLLGPCEPACTRGKQLAATAATTGQAGPRPRLLWRATCDWLLMYQMGEVAGQVGAVGGAAMSGLGAG